MDCTGSFALSGASVVSCALCVQRSVALRRALSGNLRFKGVGEAEVEFGEPWPPHVQDI